MTCFRLPGEVTFSLGGVGAGRQWSDLDEEGSMLVRGGLVGLARVVPGQNR